MRLFGKKKRDEEEEFDEEVSEKSSDSRFKKKYLKDKNFKDLDPENKRKRKEPVKQWGKGERLVVLITLIITVGMSGLLYFSSRDWNIFKLPKAESISIPFLSKNDTPVSKESAASTEVIKAITTATQSLTGTYAFYIVELEADFSYGVNEDRPLQAASLIKLPLMAAIYREAEKGLLDLNMAYRLKNLDKVGGAGILTAKPAGYEVTYRELIQLMGKQSDNTAFNILRNKLGDLALENYIEQFGMEDTSYEENKTTAKDIGMFFSKLYKGKLISDSLANELLAHLTDTAYEQWIAQGVPEDIRVSHKYGREIHVVNDAGIVFAERPYVLVILSQGVKDSEADELIPDVSEEIYNILSKVN